MPARSAGAPVVVISLSPPVCPDENKGGERLKHKFAGVSGEWVRDLARWEAFGTFTFEREVSVWGAAQCFENFAAEVIPWTKCF
jgi:hypothetical protein